MTQDERYMTRCIQLARMGAGQVAPNPMVGSVLVFENSIIGEGYHKKFGEAHAEVNCINSVEEKNKKHIPDSILYVSLEPCTHFGKTPPCADLILSNNIKKVVIGCQDIFKEVSGKGIQKLKDAGIDVITGVMEGEAFELNKRFFIFHRESRPYIILKWAETGNRKLGGKGKRLKISNELSNRLVHKWRSEEAAILIGTNTVETDDPLLTTRLWAGKNPVRIIIDQSLRLPRSLNIFNNDTQTIVYNCIKDTIENKTQYIKIDDGDFLEKLTASLFKLNIQSLIVEGGSKTLQSFIDLDLWDEARVITNGELFIEDGIEAPQLKKFNLRKQHRLGGDLISYFSREK
ncbi:MAG: bifunctional diaminohydroxyphosphoribosylaminopyrimidine deaminase/5-amino-6-(5-phosphoribosylamino)uracil reductase RibD [Ginsengibacter sp.]